MPLTSRTYFVHYTIKPLFLQAKKAKMKRNTEDLNHILKEWLNEKGYTCMEERNELIEQKN